MPSQFVRSATRSGWRGVALLALIPVLAGLFAAWAFTSNDWWMLAYVVVAAVFLVIAWRLCFGDRDA